MAKFSELLLRGKAEPEVQTSKYIFFVALAVGCGGGKEELR